MLTLFSHFDSVFPTTDVSSTPTTFTSILSLPLNPLGHVVCHPGRIVQPWGSSKDFGSNGLRGGCLVVQENPELLRSFVGHGLFMKMGSPTVRLLFLPSLLLRLMHCSSQDALWSSLLASPSLSSYFALNTAALARAYTFVTDWLRAQDLPYRPANAGVFVWCDLRRLVTGRGGGGSGEADVTQEEEVDLLERLVKGGVYLGPGSLSSYFLLSSLFSSRSY